MNSSVIFWPVLAQVLLTAVVWVRMFTVRVAEMRERRIKPQEVATSQAIASRLQNIQAADNFRNLFEVPVLFFAVCAMLASLDAVTPLQVALAWLFVGLRVRHVGAAGLPVMSKHSEALVGRVLALARGVGADSGSGDRS